MSEDTQTDEKLNAKLHELAHACADACLRGSAGVVVTIIGWNRGMPRGRFIGTSASGSRNYDVDPVKVLAWIRKQASMTQNA